MAFWVRSGSSRRQCWPHRLSNMRDCNTRGRARRWGHLPAQQRQYACQGAPEGGREPLEVDRGRREECLDTHVLEPAPNSAGEAMPALGLAVIALGPPAVTLVEAVVFGAPAFAPAPGAQQGRIIIAQHDGLVLAAFRQAEMGEIAAAAVARTGREEAPVLDGPSGLEFLAARALEDVIQGIVTEPAHRHRAADRFRLGRDNRRDLALLEPGIDPGIGVSGICRDRLDGCASQVCYDVQPIEERRALIHFAGCDLDIEHDAGLIVDGAVLLVARLQATVAAIGGHAGIGIGRADLLELAGLLRVTGLPRLLFIWSWIAV